MKKGHIDVIVSKVKKMKPETGDEVELEEDQKELPFPMLKDEEGMDYELETEEDEAKEMGLESAAEELLSSIEAKDPKGIVASIKALMDLV